MKLVEYMAAQQLKLDEYMAAQQAAQALTGTDDLARKAAGNAGRSQAVQQAAAAIDAEQKSTDPLDRRIAAARSQLATLLAQKQRQQKQQGPKVPGALTPATTPAGQQQAQQAQAPAGVPPPGVGS